MVRHQNLAGTTGFEPAISSVTGKHVRPGYTTAPHYKTWKRRRESNSRIKTLQVSTLPLGYAASSHLNWWTRGDLNPFFLVASEMHSQLCYRPIFAGFATLFNVPVPDQTQVAESPSCPSCRGLHPRCRRLQSTPALGATLGSPNPASRSLRSLR